MVAIYHRQNMLSSKHGIQARTLNAKLKHRFNNHHIVFFLLSVECGKWMSNMLQNIHKFTSCNGTCCPNAGYWPGCVAIDSWKIEIIPSKTKREYKDKINILTTDGVALIRRSRRSQNDGNLGRPKSENANIGWAWPFQIVIRFMVHFMAPNFRL